MLDDIEQNYDVHLPDALEARRVRHPLQDIQSRAPAVYDGLCGELDARDVEMPRCFHEKEAVGASELEQFAAIAIAANEIDAVSKLAAEHRLSAEIIGVTIRASAGKI